MVGVGCYLDRVNEDGNCFEIAYCTLLNEDGKVVCVIVLKTDVLVTCVLLVGQRRVDEKDQAAGE